MRQFQNLFTNIPLFEIRSNGFTIKKSRRHLIKHFCFQAIHVCSSQTCELSLWHQARCHLSKVPTLSVRWHPWPRYQSVNIHEINQEADEREPAARLQRIQTLQSFLPQQAITEWSQALSAPDKKQTKTTHAEAALWQNVFLPKASSAQTDFEVLQRFGEHSHSNCLHGNDGIVCVTQKVAWNNQERDSKLSTVEWPETQEEITLVFERMGAARSSSISTTCSWPLLAPQCSGVRPSQ